MNRTEFIKLCGLFGISIPLQGMLMSFNENSSTNQPFSGKVIIIGAGAGGLSAAYFLNQKGTEFEILEASSGYGGRMRINTDFADFPIPLGSEWLETKTNIFEDFVNDDSVEVDVDTVQDTTDRKFVNYSWYNFFEEYIVPSIASKISFNTVVQSIDYSDDQVLVNTQSGQYSADKVILSVPLKILQDGDITFTPGLPQTKLDAINNTVIWGGFKAFVEFSSDFYGSGLVVSDNTNGQKIYYNASFGQNTSKNIIGLFVVGTPVQEYMDASDEQIISSILNELDEKFENQASPTYIKHITQNWNNEPYIKAGYMSDYADWRTVRTLGTSVDSKLYFSGGAFTDGEDWVSVHTTAQSAKSAIEEINA